MGGDFEMEDLAARLRALSDLGRVSLIGELIRIDTSAQSRARKGQRARLGSVDRNRSETALWESDRLGRFIYFLRFRTPATNTSGEDMALCDMIARKLQAKNDWTGEIES
jgi:hypothetical protein